MQVDLYNGHKMVVVVVAVALLYVAGKVTIRLTSHCPCTTDSPLYPHVTLVASEGK